MAAMAPEHAMIDSAAVAGVKRGHATALGAQEGVRFRAFVKMRRAERQRVQDTQDAQRNKGRKKPTTALAVSCSTAAAPRLVPTKIPEAREKPGELLGYPMVWEAVHRTALASCVDSSGMLRSGCVPTLLKLAEDVDSLGDRVAILQALEATAQENWRLARFLELGGAVVLGRWLSDASKDLTPGKAQATVGTNMQQRGHADPVLEFALLCLRVVSLLPLTKEEACTSGILETCQQLDGSCPQVQQIVVSLMVQWQLLPTADEDDSSSVQRSSPAAPAAATEQVHDVREVSVQMPLADLHVDGPLGKESLDSHIDAIVNEIAKFEEMFLNTTIEECCILAPSAFRSKFQELAELLRPCMYSQNCKLPSTSLDKIQMLARKLHGFMAGVNMSVAKSLAADLVVVMPLLQKVIASLTQQCPRGASEGTDVVTADKPIVSPAESQIHEVLADVKFRTESHRWDCFIHSQTQSPIEL